MEYQVYDNFLDKPYYLKIRDYLLSDRFPWYLHTRVAGCPDEENDPNTFYFVHHFYEGPENKSNQSHILNPLIDKLDPITIIRVKGNLYPRTDRLFFHERHIDYYFYHQAAIFYLNDNDGYTVLEDGTKIESVANRLLLFDASKEHNSTTCTNSKVRANINFNYISQSFLLKK